MIRARGQSPSALPQQTLAVVMAGGNGTRLGDLTRWHAKPALPFGGQYRNIDFPLSNCVNSGIRRIAVLTQYKAHSLIQHVQRGWSFLPPEIGEFVEIWPAQQRRNKSWYAGTADAIFQNIDLINAYAPDHVLVLAGDHVYKMDYLRMLEEHVASGADVTIGCVDVPLEQASEFGIMTADARGRVVRFEEKPAIAAPMPENPHAALASMGIYVFDRDLLVSCLMADAGDEDSGHDFGRDIIPSLIGACTVQAYAFRDPYTGRQAYWRDVGTVDGYWQANMELLAESPELDLYDRAWPIWTQHAQCPPPRFLGEGSARQSIISGGCSIAGTVERSLLSPNCRVGKGSRIRESVVLGNAEIGRGCVIERAIVDFDCVIPDGFAMSGSALEPGERYHVSAKGVTVVTAEAIGSATRPRAARRVA